MPLGHNSNTPCNILRFIKLVWPIFEQLKCGAIFEIQTTLNYGPHFWKLQKWCKVFKTLGKGKELAMPSLGSRGAHVQHGKISKHLSWTTLFEFKSNSNEPKTLWHFKSPHGITTSSTMSSLIAIEQSKVTWRKYKVALGLLQLSPTNTGSRPGI